MSDHYFARKRMRTLFYCLLLLVMTAAAIVITEFDVVTGFTSIPQAAIWVFDHFYPDAKAMKRLPDIIDSLIETILVSVAATTVAALFALIFAMAGSITTGRGGIFSVISRSVATVFRNIDVAAWSMILLISFGQNVLTGYLALFFGSFGFLTRAFIETIDEMSNSSVEALKSTGAGYLTIMAQSVIPSCIPQLISWVLFMMETNIRQATLIGILTGTGIGFLFSLYYKSLDFHSASLIVIALVLTIAVFETVSNYIRKVIM
ncbi:phosphonate ABC transporter permease [Paenibacillus swuensis]|uniref:Phosphonate ABC transporter permease n=1 Tax=Paenibacillus swuensis TaxID=1178515 RepID=A0A172TFW2_9BACL|nr:ABC transporter permease subunit [Paenibacillus swuensis]ANE45826.1 phosphonate ABC transporter permease [Paenibacillus swuensis]